MMFSEQQKYAIAAVAGTISVSQHLVLIAVAGSGKTTTLLEMIKQAVARGSNVAYVVFNRKNANEATQKLGFLKGAFVNTAHGFGRRAWLATYPKCQAPTDQLDTEKTKYTRIFQELQIPENLQHFVKKLVSLAKKSAFIVEINADERSNWEELAYKHELDQCFCNEEGDPLPNFDQLLTAGLRASYAALKLSIKLSKEIIDHDDCLFMPVLQNCTLYKYDLVFHDEIQDTNPIILCLITKMLKREGRYIGVGDPRQAIYMFTGAYSDAIENIKKRFNATELPLTVSFRCPKTVVKFVQQWVDHIQAAPEAIEGSVSRIEEKDLLKQYQLDKEDGVICRSTAPLVEYAYMFLRAGIPCHVEGRKIGEGLISMLDKWKKPKTVGAYKQALNKYNQKMQAKYLAAKEESKAEELNDKIETLYVICDGVADDEPLEVLKTKIRNLFTDTDGGKAQTLTLATIHKSKGREWDRVFWVGRNILQPSKYATSKEAIQQEINLMYVAGTRAKQDLIEINLPTRQ